jgi:hypothetical protein
MKLKSEAHETLLLVFNHDGVLPRMIMDKSKEQSLGKFLKKCKEADCHLVNTEPYSPWQQASEGGIKETKRGFSCKMIRTGTPKHLWDHSLGLEGLLRSHTAMDIYELHGQVPETVMTGQTPDISNLCEYEWFQWVMYYDPPRSYPNDKSQLGHYLGPVIDVVSSMT